MHKFVAVCVVTVVFCVLILGEVIRE